MKAVRFSRFGGPEALEIVALPDPHPGPGQIRIAVRAVGVNPGDCRKRKGRTPRQRQILVVGDRLCALPRRAVFAACSAKSRHGRNSNDDTNAAYGTISDISA